MKKITIVVVDDHRLVREMWQELFRSRLDIEVIGDSGLFNEAVELIRSKRPDIVLLDINLAESSGFDIVPLVKKYAPGTKIISVSMHAQPAYAKKMLQLGAMGYVTKNSSREEIFLAIRQVLEGKKFICQEIKEIISDKVMVDGPAAPHINDLSLREVEIIKYIKEGHSSKEIASHLCISIRTVEVHRHNILKKLKLKNSAALVSFIHNKDLSL
ncbi:MAG: response regulator [Flavisolibacter sp.]